MTDAASGSVESPRLARLGTLFGAVVAPSTFVTALLYYFGYWHAYWFFDYFGVNSTMLGFGTVDYLMRSLDALFVPMVVVAAGSLIAFWGHTLLSARLASRIGSPSLRIFVPFVAGVGFLLALGGFWSVLDARVFLRDHLVAAPLSLAFGVILLTYALHLYRALPPVAGPPTPRNDDDPENEPANSTNNEPADSTNDDPERSSPPAASPTTRRPEWTAVAEWGVVFALVGLSLIWAANDYAAAVGRGRAEQQASQLADSPTAVLYSERRLDLGAPGVREVRCRDPKSAYPFRYEGLTLLMQSADQYVLLPQAWTPATGVAVVLPRTDSVRIEFVPYSARATLGRATC
ncbi:hypothetical protein ACIQI8_34000 [Streptomyces sp. NPDC092369]|uniref:hypothetical protein n=1 Tax=Streptomyces sp. NPDC092369 TaxID=3366015 RepID=UPI0037F5F329